MKTFIYFKSNDQFSLLFFYSLWSFIFKKYIFFILYFLKLVQNNHFHSCKINIVNEIKILTAKNYNKICLFEHPNYIPSTQQTKPPKFNTISKRWWEKMRHKKMKFLKGGLFFFVVVVVTHNVVVHVAYKTIVVALSLACDRESTSLIPLIVSDLLHTLSTRLIVVVAIWLN